MEISLVSGIVYLLEYFVFRRNIIFLEIVYLVTYLTFLTSELQWKIRAYIYQ